MTMFTYGKRVQLNLDLTKTIILVEVIQLLYFSRSKLLNNSLINFWDKDFMDITWSHRVTLDEKKGGKECLLIEYHLIKCALN